MLGVAAQELFDMYKNALAIGVDFDSADIEASIFQQPGYGAQAHLSSSQMILNTTSLAYHNVLFPEYY